MTQIGQWASWIGESKDGDDAATAQGVSLGPGGAPGASGSGADTGGVGGVGGGAGRGGGGGGGRAGGAEEGSGGGGGLYRSRLRGGGSPRGGRGGDAGVADAGGGAGGGGRGGVAAAVVDEWRKAGASDAVISGVLANIQHESAWKTGALEKNPTGAAKRLGGGHGLYQFTGPGEWGGYQKWLAKNYPGQSWTDPRLQTRFVIHQLKSGVSGPGAWNKLMASKSGGEAAIHFVKDYLRPRADLRRQREAQYGRGVPNIEHYTRGADAASGVSGSTAPAPSGGGRHGFYPGSGRPLGSVAPHFKRSGHVDTRMDPVLVERLNQAYAAAPPGEKFTVISGYRSPALQAQLYSRYKSGRGGVAAPPGHSQHNFGRAADIGRGAGFNWLHRNAHRFGLVFPHTFDQPHIQVDPNYKG